MAGWAGLVQVVWAAGKEREGESWAGLEREGVRGKVLFVFSNLYTILTNPIEFKQLQILGVTMSVCDDKEGSREGYPVEMV